MRSWCPRPPATAVHLAIPGPSPDGRLYPPRTANRWRNGWISLVIRDDQPIPGAWLHLPAGRSCDPGPHRPGELEHGHRHPEHAEQEGDQDQPERPAPAAHHADREHPMKADSAAKTASSASRSHRAGEGSGLQPPGGCPALLDPGREQQAPRQLDRPGAGPAPLREWLAEWWSTTTNLRPSTRARAEMLLRRYALPRFGNQPPAAIRQREVRAWVADLAATDLAPSTVRKTHHLLGKVLAAAVDAGMIASRHASGCRCPRSSGRRWAFAAPARPQNGVSAAGTRSTTL
jgi:Phage integrase, N-terminal SAM-like domain